MTDEEKELMQALQIKDMHNNRPRINGVGVYSWLSKIPHKNKVFPQFRDKLTLARHIDILIIKEERRKNGLGSNNIFSN